MKITELTVIFYFIVIFNTSNGNRISIDDDDNLGKLIEIFEMYQDVEYQHKINVVVIEDRNKIGDQFLKYINGREVSKTAVVNLVGGCNINNIQKSYDGIEHISMITIFMSPTIEALNRILDCLKYTYIWKPLSRILLVLNQDPGKEKIIEFFTTIWKRKLLNFSIISNSKIFGFNPFFKNFYETSPKKIFYNKLSNLNGYKINILLGRDDDYSKVWVRKLGNTIEYHGKDGNMICSILEHINATFQVIVVDKFIGIELNPWRTMNFGVYDHLKEPIIKNTSADFLFDSRDVMVDKYTENLYPHANDDYAIMLPHMEISQQKYILQLFEHGLVYYLFLLLFISPIITYIIRVIANKIKIRSKNGSFSDDIFRNIELLVGLSTTRLPKSLAEKIFFTLILLSCLVVNNYFQSMLKSVLTVSEAEPEIRTIKKLAESGIKIKCPKNLVQHIKMFFQGTPQMSLIPNFEDVSRADLTSLATRKILLGGCANMDRLEIFMTLQPQMYLLRESLIPNYISIHVVKDSPYSEVLERNIRKIIESGMYDMWKKETLRDIRMMNPVNSTVVEKFKSFDLVQFRFAFYFIGVGLLISIVAFVVEIMSKYVGNFCENIKKRKMKNTK